MRKAIKIQDIQTMSSLEIAALTGKDHSDVLYDIRNTLEQAGLGEGNYSSSYKSKQNKTLPMFLLPKLECDLVISGYSVPYRLAIIQRWHELEASNNQSISHSEVRQDARLAFKDMGTALKVTRAEQGKETKSHHYSNEAELLNRLVIGMTSKQYRVEHNLKTHEAIRDHFSFQELATIEELERTNIALINLGEDYETRKHKLMDLYNRRHKQLLIEEVLRLEA